MAVTVTATPSSGTATQTVFRIDAAGLSDTDTSNYDAGDIPTEPGFRYYFEMSEGGTIKGRSAIAQPDSADGNLTWFNVITPDAGDYTFSVKRCATATATSPSASDTTVGSVGVTIS